jgi:tryptophan 2,3-dioxygenase
MSDSRKPLLYSTYINDRAIVEALDLPDTAPAGTPPDEWPVKPTGWTPGDDWPHGGQWAHDEVLFIRTHQAFEVWFALIVHELASVVDEASRLGGEGGFSFEPIDLGERDREFDARAPRLAAARDRWPLSWALVDEARRADPHDEVAAALDQLCEPCFQGTVTTLSYPEFGDSDAFHLSLRRWERRLRRAAAALHGTIGFFDILATMAPADFLAFRGRLQPASGFGSAQFREIEYLLGLTELHATRLQPDGSGPPVDGPEPPPGMAKPRTDTPSGQRTQSFYVTQSAWGQARIARRARGLSLRDIVYGLLHSAYDAARQDPPGHRLPPMKPAALDRWYRDSLADMLEDQYRGLSPRRLDASGRASLAQNVEAFARGVAQSEVVTATLFAGMRDPLIVAGFLEACLRMDDALLQWRDRHIRFVEAMIGSRRGTGGGGIAYLRGTVASRQAGYRTHALPCLWQARTFVRRRA